MPTEWTHHEVEVAKGANSFIVLTRRLSLPPSLAAGGGPQAATAKAGYHLVLQSGATLHILPPASHALGSSAVLSRSNADDIAHRGDE